MMMEYEALKVEIEALQLEASVGRDQPQCAEGGTRRRRHA
jgi:hypothetical protein